MVPSPHLQAEALSLVVAQPPRLVERAVSAPAFPPSLHLISHESISRVAVCRGLEWLSSEDVQLENKLDPVTSRPHCRQINDLSGSQELQLF